ncbi:hypothetical protein BH11BAC1_BH11BAC1_21460 [soil metagenome]
MPTNRTMKIKIGFFHIALLALLSPAFSQTNKVDSLLKELSKRHPDTTAAQLRISLGEALERSNPDSSELFYIDGINFCDSFLSGSKPLNDASKSALLAAKSIGINGRGMLAKLHGDKEKAIIFYQQALSIAQSINNAEGIATCLTNIGKVKQDKGENEEAIKLYEQALAICIKAKNNSIAAAITNNLGIVYLKEGNTQKVLEYFTISRKYYEDDHDSLGIARSFNNIGAFLERMGDIPKALENLHEALRIRERLNNTREILVTTNNIGNILKQQGEYDKAMVYFNRALLLTIKMNDAVNKALTYSYIATTYKAQKNNLKAIEFLKLSLKTFDQANERSYIPNVLNNIGDFYSSTKQYDSALTYLKQGRQMAIEIKDKREYVFSTSTIGEILLSQHQTAQSLTYALEAVKESYSLGYPININISEKLLSDVMSATGNYKSAYEHYKLYILYRDSTLNEKTKKESIKKEFQYDYEKKEALLRAEQESKNIITQKEIEKQKLTRNTYAGGTIMFLILSGVLYNRSRIKQKSNKELKEKNIIITNEKNRSEELLLNILPYETAQELKNKGSSDARQFDEVTVMFTDFKDFTSRAENLSAKELVADIDYCYKAFDEIIGRHGIEKIKTIGDSYMCAGGLPVANKTNAVDMLRAALEIKDFIWNEKQNRESTGKTFFEIRIGVHTGPVVAGIVGVKKFAYDIWGDTVNIASRMQSSGEVGKVNISGSTYLLVKDKFTCIHRGKIEAKNKGLIDMYFVEPIS